MITYNGKKKKENKTTNENKDLKLLVKVTGFLFRTGCFIRKV